MRGAGVCHGRPSTHMSSRWLWRWAWGCRSAARWQPLSLTPPRLRALPAGCRGSVLRMRHYSVTPLGRRAGLVQWVRHTTSLFSLFRTWQRSASERAAAVAAAAVAKPPPAAAAQGHASAPAAAQPLPLMVSVARPADAFYAKLLPALQRAGLAAGTTRQDWPPGKSSGFWGQVIWAGVCSMHPACAYAGLCVLQTSCAPSWSA
jgi:hypothetical protein